MGIFFLAFVMGVILFPHSVITMVLVFSAFSLCFFVAYFISSDIKTHDEFFEKLKNTATPKKAMVILALLSLVPLFILVWIQSLIFPERKEVMEK